MKKAMVLVKEHHEKTPPEGGERGSFLAEGPTALESRHRADQLALVMNEIMDSNGCGDWTSKRRQSGRPGCNGPKSREQTSHGLSSNGHHEKTPPLGGGGVSDQFAAIRK